MSSPTPQWYTWWNWSPCQERNFHQAGLFSLSTSTPQEPQGLPYRDILWQESLYNNLGAVLEFLRFAFSVFFLGAVSFTTISTNGWWLPTLYIQLWPLHWNIVDWTAPHRCLVHVSRLLSIPTHFPPANPQPLTPGRFLPFSVFGLWNHSPHYT